MKSKRTKRLRFIDYMRGDAGIIDGPIALVISLAIILGVGIGAYVEMHKVGQIGEALQQTASQVSSDLQANGCLTTENITQIDTFLRNNGLDPADVYLNSTSGRETYGSSNGNAIIGYNFTIQVPILKTPIYQQYIERPVENITSTYVPNATLDSSTCATSFSGTFGGTQEISDLGNQAPPATLGNVAISTNITLTGPTTATVGSTHSYSGVVMMGSNPAPQGTSVTISTPSGTITTQVSNSSGNYQTNISFSTVSSGALITATSGVATAQTTVAVTPNSPSQIIFTNLPGGMQVQSNDPSNYVAIIGVPITITGSVTDTNGNGISNYSLNVSGSTPDVPTTPITTNAQGNFSLTYTPHQTGTETVTFSNGTLSSIATVTVTQANPQSLSLTVSNGGSYGSTTTVTAGQTVTFKGQVLGLYNSPYENANVSLTSNSDLWDTFMPGGQPYVTGSDGYFTTNNIRMTKAGTQIIGAGCANLNTAQVTVDVQPGSPSQVKGLTITPSRISQGSTFTIRGLVEDTHGNAVIGGTSVSIVFQGNTTDITTLSDGTFSSTLKASGPQTGNVPITVQSGSTALDGGSSSINVLASSGYQISLTMKDLSNQAVTQCTVGDTLTAVVTITDDTGTPVQGKTLTYSESVEPSALVQLTAITNSSGQASITVGPLQRASNHGLSVSIEGVTGAIGTTMYTVKPGSPYQVNATVSPNITQANPVAPPIVTGVLCDQYGNTVPNTPLTISGGYGANASGTTDANGNFTISIHPTNIGGPFPITVISGPWSNTPTGLKITVTTLVSYSMTLSFSNSPVTVGESVTATATVKDAGGNPVSGLAIDFSSPSQSDATISAPANTDGNGQTTVSVTYTKVGQQVLVGTYHNVQASSSLTVNSVNPAINSSLHINGLTLSPNVVVKNPSQGPIVTGTLLDSYNNPVSNTTVTVSGGWGASSSGTTSAAGVFTITLNPTNTGTYGLTITSGLYSNTYNTPELTLTVTATQGYQLTVSAPSGTSAGVPVMATATLLNQTGAAVSGVTIEFNSPTGVAIISSPNPTDSSGKTVVQVSWTKASSQIIQASYQSNVHASSAVTVTPGSPTSVNATVSPFTTEQWRTEDPVPLPIVSGTVTDSYANPVLGASITVSGGYGANVTNTTDSNGYYSTSVKPTNIGGPFALNFEVTSTYGNYNTIQGNLTVTAPLVVPVDKVLEGTTIAGQTGTMINRSTQAYHQLTMNTVVGDYSGDGYPSVYLQPPGGYYDGSTWVRSREPDLVPSNILGGRTVLGVAGGIPNNYGIWQYALYAAPGEGRIHLYPPAGYYDGNSGTGVYFDDPDFTASNIKNGVNVYGVTGTYIGGPATHGSQTYATPGSYSFTVPAGVTSLNIHVTGGGGGGGAGDGPYDNQGSGGGGGAGGTYVDVITVTPGEVIPVIVGGGGNGGLSGYHRTPVNSGDGGNSSFASYIAYGGGAGTCGETYPYAPGGAGGAGGGRAGGTGANGNNGLYVFSESGHLIGDKYGIPGGTTPGAGGSGGYDRGELGADGQVLLLW